MLDRPQVLVVGNDDGLMDLIFEQLVKAFAPCVLEFTAALSIAVNRLAEVSFDAILLDLSVVNHGKRAAIAAIRSVASEIPLFLLLDRRSGPQETDPYGFGPGACIFKDKLKQGIWIVRGIEEWTYGKALSLNN